MTRSPRFLHLLQQRASLVLGRVTSSSLCAGFGRSGPRRPRQDALLLGPGLLLGVGHQDLRFGHPLGRRRLGALWISSAWLLGLADAASRPPLLGLDHDPRRLVVGVAEDLRAVLAERRGQRRLVDHGVGRPLLGLGHRRPQLLLLLLQRLELRATDWR